MRRWIYNNYLGKFGNFRNLTWFRCSDKNIQKSAKRLWDQWVLNTEKLNHSVIKDQLKPLPISFIKALEYEERMKVMSIITEGTIGEDLNWRLTIGDDSEREHDWGTDDSIETRILKEWNKLECFGGKKKTWYSQEGVGALKILMNEFPEHHKKIRKLLKIPPSSFNRLRKEIIEERTKSKISKRSLRESENLKNSEKELITKLLEPPTFPITLKEI